MVYNFEAGVVYRSAVGDVGGGLRRGFPGGSLKGNSAGAMREGYEEDIFGGLL